MNSTRQPWLEAQAINLSFGGVKALKDVNLTLEPGARLGLIGPNGSGKTTLLNVLSGVYLPTSGSIKIEGREITRTRAGTRGRLGIIRTLQHPQLAASLTIEENVMLGARLSRHHGLTGKSRRVQASTKERVDAMLKLFRCWDYRNGLPEEVPYGTRKIAEVARAAAADPSLLLLDEPAAGLSAEERVELVQSIGEYVAENSETALCLVEHDVPLVSEICNELLVLNAGATLRRGETQEVLSDPRVREAYLGTSGRKPAADKAGLENKVEAL